MSQNLVINITTKDGASQAFRTIASNAKAMGSSLQSAGSGATSGLGKISTEASKADAALDKLGDSAEDAASGLDKIGSTATKVGAALGTGIAAISKFGQQAENQRRQVEGINLAYGDAAQEILRFTDAIQGSTKFSNEDAREAAQIAATLAQNYGFTADEIETLISVSADLATVHGTTLSDAVQRTSSAMRGEAESAEALGLTLNQSAIDRENLTLSMSNEEAAHFRLNALLDQSAYAQGAAGDAAATAAGKAAQAANAMQDVTTKIGQALGPVAGVTAGFADLALALPAIGAGAGKMIASLSQAGGKMAALGSSAASLVGLINPVGIALGAVALAAAVVIKRWQDNEAANAALAQSYDGLAAAIAQTQTATQQVAAQDIRFDWPIEEQKQKLIELGVITTDVFGQISATTVEEGQRMQAAFDAMTLSTEEQAQANNLLATSYLEVASDGMNPLILALNKVETGAESFRITGDDTIAMLTDLSAALSYGGDGADIIQTAIANLNTAYAEGRITQAQYAEGLDYLATHTAEYVAGLQSATEATEELTEAQIAANRQRVIDGLEGQSARYNALADSIQATRDAMAAPAMASGLGFGLGLDDDARAEIEAYGDQIDAAKDAQRELDEATASLATNLRSQLVPGIDGASAALQKMAAPGDDVLDTLQRIDPALQSAGGGLLRLADGLQDAAQAMDGVLSTFSAIDALGSRSSTAGGIAEKLVGSPGEWATIDDMLQRGVISLEEYNATLEAGYAIQTRDATIQEDLNRIRAAQLPLLAEQEAQYGAYINRLAEAGPLEQQQALYLMDSANQAKVAAAYSTAYAASLGEIPEDVATEIIAESAQADPILAGILESFGLIERGADGSVSVNFEDATTLQDVTASIDRLNNTQITIALALADGELTGEEIEAIRAGVAEIDGKTATVTVDAQDNTGGVVDDAAAGVESLDGKTATTTIDAKDNASQTVADANAEVDSFDGKTATATVNVETNFSTQAAKSPLTGADKPQDQTVTISIVADDQASTVIADVMAQAQLLASVDGAITLTATDDASSVISRVMAAATALSSVDGGVTLTADDQASSAVARAMQAGNGFDGQTYTADLTVNDQTGSPIAQAMQAGNAWATTYTGTLNATDAASSVIAQAMQAGNAFAVTYTGTLAATDSASSVVAQAMQAANAFATTYSATLQASDSASGTISNVATALANLDGSTATVYVNAVDNTGGVVGKQLGGVIQIPHAANGRVVQVGEAGPENVMLPYGAIVQPHPASLQPSAPDPMIQDQKKYKKDLMPDIDMKKAYKKGGDSAKAFYDGLFDEAKRRVQDQADEINSTVYGSKEEAEAAIADYKRFVQERDKIGRKREKAKDFDKDQKKAEKAAQKGEEAFASMETAADKSGAKAGKSIDKGISSGIGVAEKAIGKLTSVLDTLGKTVSEPDVKADTTNADKGISGVQTDLTTLGTKSATVTVKVNDKAWTDFLSEVSEAALGVVVTVKTKEKSSEGKMLGGVIQDHVPAAALGRVITVGEAGPEAVLLPYGSMVVPHPASGSQVQSEQTRSLNIYGNVHVYAANNDVYGAIQGQLVGIGR